VDTGPGIALTPCDSNALPTTLTRGRGREPSKRSRLRIPNTGAGGGTLPTNIPRQRALLSVAGHSPRKDADASRRTRSSAQEAPKSGRRPHDQRGRTPTAAQDGDNPLQALRVSTCTCRTSDSRGSNASTGSEQLAGVCVTDRTVYRKYTHATVVFRNTESPH
jgi:hypothetical protein